jgi:acetyl-CoA carboxylase biotin carboxyl carrier protein
MDLEHLKQLLELIHTHELAEFELEDKDVKLKVKRNVGGIQMQAVAAPAVMQMPLPALPAAPAAPPSLADAAAAAGGEEIELAVVKSPIVGTFYRSPEPGAPAFVEVGATVKKGQVLCIIEAMKLMNEIDSEYDGEIVNVYVESGQPVQYGERLFAIRTK